MQVGRQPRGRPFPLGLLTSSVATRQSSREGVASEVSCVSHLWCFFNLSASAPVDFMMLRAPMSASLLYKPPISFRASPCVAALSVVG